MELHQLRYVVAVARTANFSRAAALCHVSQPSLSQQIKKLEDELGERLFDRMKRAVKLTSQGETFLHRALRILEEVDAAKREASDAQHLLRGALTIGVLPTIAPYLLPKVMAQFTNKFPGVEIVVEEDTTARLLKLALDYEIKTSVWKSKGCFRKNCCWRCRRAIHSPANARWLSPTWKANGLS
jgi:LysR family hydrogen peroxide-inducible transcriptional activator